MELKKLAESPAVAILLFSGMVGNAQDRMKVATEEVERAAKNILYMETDTIVIPTGLYQSQRVENRMSVVQNANSLTHTIDLLSSKKFRGSNHDPLMAQKKSISTLQIAHAITSAAIDEYDRSTPSNNPIDDDKPMSLLYKVIYSNTAWFIIYFFLRWYVLYMECEGAMENVQWSEYLVIFFSALAPWCGGQYWATHAATPYCDFRRRNFMEAKLSMLIHQMEIYSTKDIDSWRRLRLCLQEMGAPYYKGMIQYNGFIVLSSILFNIIVALLMILKVQPVTSGKISFSYICIPLVYFNFIIQFWVLIGMREGSRVNRIAIDHVHEWIKVQQRLNQKIESEREELNGFTERIEELKILRQKEIEQNEQSFEEMDERIEKDVEKDVDDDHKGGGEDDKEEEEDDDIDTCYESVDDELQEHVKHVKELTTKIRKLKSAKDSVHLLCEELNLEITFRGMRMFSMRLSKILFKSLFALFVYEIYYATIYFIADGDLRNLMGMML